MTKKNTCTYVPVEPGPAKVSKGREACREKGKPIGTTPGCHGRWRRHLLELLPLDISFSWRPFFLPTCSDPIPLSGRPFVLDLLFLEFLLSPLLLVPVALPVSCCLSGRLFLPDIFFSRLPLLMMSLSLDPVCAFSIWILTRRTTRVTRAVISLLSKLPLPCSMSTCAKVQGPIKQVERQALAMHPQRGCNFPKGRETNALSSTWSTSWLYWSGRSWHVVATCSVGFWSPSVARWPYARISAGPVAQTRFPTSQLGRALCEKT